MFSSFEVLFTTYINGQSILKLRNHGGSSMKKQYKKASGQISMVLPTTVLGILMVVIIVFLVAINQNLATLNSNLAGTNVKQQQQLQPQPTAQQPDQQQAPVQLSVGDAPVRGDANAKVTMIEFSDFECPFCEKWYTDNMQQLQDKYISTGKVKFVFKNFPLSFHPLAEKAAEAAECAGQQGKYWEFHDNLFTTRNLTVDQMKSTAKDMGLDTTKFNNCLDSGSTAAGIQADINEGSAAGVSGTPTFFINGQKIVGAQPFAAFDSAIQQALSAQ